MALSLLRTDPIEDTVCNALSLADSKICVYALQEFAVIVYGLLSTLLPNRLPRARFAVAQYLAVAVVLVMVSSCCFLHCAAPTLLSWVLRSIL
jgi:hypothetical protein